MYSFNKAYSTHIGLAFWEKLLNNRILKRFEKWLKYLYTLMSNKQANLAGISNIILSAVSLEKLNLSYITLLTGSPKNQQNQHLP